METKRTHKKLIEADYARRNLTTGKGGQVMQMRNAEKRVRHEELRRVRRESHEAAIKAFRALPVAEQSRRLRLGGAKQQARAAKLLKVA